MTLSRDPNLRTMTISATRQIKTRGYRRDTPGLLFGSWPSQVILISGAVDGWQRMAPELLVALQGVQDSRILRLAFEDTVSPTDECAPTIQDINKIVEFAETLSDGCRLLSVCPGGFGRSSAASWICWTVWGLTPDDGLDRVLEDRAVATPNRLMIALADETLDLKGRLWRTYARWMDATVGVKYEPPIPLARRRADRLRAMGPRHRGGGR